MEIVSEGKKRITLFWKGSPNRCATYRLMQYVVTDFKDDHSHPLILNTVTGELLLLNDEEKLLLDRLPAVYTDEMDYLILHRFLVPMDFDESKSVDQLRLLQNSLTEKEGVTSFSILPTTSCNARCFYCFESDEPRVTMTQETVCKVIDYITSQCSERKKVSLKWFGGEPTLGATIIDQICDSLAERGFSYSSSMISNAYLFDREMVQRAKEKWKLASIQITIDGTEEIYNKTKAYVGVGGSPYRRLMDNIRLLLDAGIHVSVRMNLDYHNIVDLKNLVMDLGSRFRGIEHFSVYAAPLFEDQGYEPVSHNAIEHEELLNTIAELHSLIEQVGCNKSSYFSLQNELPSLRLRYCMAVNPNSIQINPRGEFGKCEHNIFSQLVGDVGHGYNFESDINQYWLKPKYLEACKNCHLYPVCGMIESCEEAVACIPVQIQEKISDIKRLMRFNYGQYCNLVEKMEENKNEKAGF